MSHSVRYYLGQYWYSILSFRIINQFLLFALVVIGVTVLSSLCMAHIDHSFDFSSAAEYFIIGGERQMNTYAQYFHNSYNILIALLFGIWQATLIFKIMMSDDHIFFSENLSYYDHADSSKGVEQRPYLVFRIMNDGFNNLYNIKISAVFRYFHAGTGTYQHYQLSVQSDKMPVFEVGMPFRVYICTGKVSEAVDNKFLLDKVDDDGSLREIVDSDNDINLIPHPDKINNAPLPDHEFLIFVEAFDSFLGRTNISKKTYQYKEMKRGRFANIRSRAEQGLPLLPVGRNWRYFQPDEVRNLFSTIE